MQQKSDAQMVTTKDVFSRVTDVLFQIIINGDISAVLNLRLVNKSTYEAIGLLEPHICRWFMRLHNINAFSPLITLNPQTGGQRPVTLHTLPRFIYRQHTASQLARRIIPSVWGPFIDDGNPEMDYNAELKLAQTLERGLHVLFHFADVYHDTQMQQVKDGANSATHGPGRRLVLTWGSDLYDDLLEHRSQSMTFDKDIDHIYAVLESGHLEAEIGRKRLRLRSYLDEQNKIDFHAALRMLQELMVRMLLRHGPKESVALGISWTVTGRSGRTTWSCDVTIATVEAAFGAGARSWQDVLSTLQSSRPLFSSYLRIRSLAKSPSNPELQQARAELEATLTDLTADLDDLVESVRAIEQDPYRYGLEIDEVARRRKLVDEVGDEVEKMREELQRVVTTADTAGGTKAHTGSTSGLPNPSDFDNVLSPSDDRGDDYYTALEQQRQMELMHEQDEQLDGVFRTVGNLRQQADDMGRELEEQAVMIDEVDTLADRVGGKLSNGMSRIKHIVRKNEDTMSSFCIAALIFVLVLLLILVIAL
ncbi:hypothetical protein EMGR_004632 [Emarellia grisea]